MTEPLSFNQLRVILEVNQALSGSYNHEGILNWWYRPRHQLNGDTPMEALQGPMHDGPLRVLLLAKALEG